MKITVIIGPDGKILGTARYSSTVEEEQPVAYLIAGPGQTAHEMELPSDLEDIHSAEDLHTALERHLRSVRQKG